MAIGVVRRGRDGDLDCIDRLYNHFVKSTHITFDTQPYGARRRLEWFEKFQHSGRYQLFVACLDGKFAGFAHSSPFKGRAAYDTSVETTIYLAPELSGQGLGYRLYATLLEALRDEDINRVYGLIALPNDASIALHRKFGYREVGHLSKVGRKFDKYWDVKYFELRIASLQT